MTDVDLTEFEALSEPKRKTCGVGLALAALEPAEATKLGAACGTDIGIITNAAVSKWLKARGHAVNFQAIGSHRRGTCTCHD